MKKWLITDFRKVNLYGDWMAISDKVMQAPFRGKRLDVKILGLFWITYKVYFVK